MKYDVAIVGGGPAGLCAALEAAARGVSVGVFERQAVPADKACGEGLLPRGLGALARHGVLPLLGDDDGAPFDAITYVQEDGRSATGRLPEPGGMGIRRLSLHRAMAQRARALGVPLHERCGVRSVSIEPEGVRLRTDQGEALARLLVAADGLHSPLRRSLGLGARWGGARRFGLRRHAAVAPWGRSVEVHFAEGVEAYVTPAGRACVGVAFLWEDGLVPQPVSFEALLGRFPRLRERLSGAPWSSEARGAGPLRQLVTARTGERVVLLGDAAGYVDAITGEGLSLAFEGAAALGAILPAVLAADASRASLEPYARAMRAEFDRYARLASLLVWTARRPALRRFVVDRLVDHPAAFGWMLRRLLPAGDQPQGLTP